MLKGGETVKSLSTAFLADLEEDWRAHGKKVFPVLREKYPQAYFSGLVALSKMIRWETAEEMLSGGSMTPDEIIEKLEQRVGPQGRKSWGRGATAAERAGCRPATCSPRAASMILRCPSRTPISLRS